MKATKKTSVEGEWAKVGETINDGDKIRIEDAGQIVEGDYGPRNVFKILTKKRENLIMSFNQTSMNNLIDAFGDETESWKGKVVNVFTLRVMVSGKLRNVAYIAADGWKLDEDGRFVSPEREEKDYPKDDINPEDIPF